MADSFSAGRDPLGLQAASVRLYSALLPGLTNVTNRLRYYSFYCWALWQFEQVHHSTKEGTWIPFIRRAEALYALACEIGDSTTAFGMAGSRYWGPMIYDTAIDTFDLIVATDRPGKNGQYLKATYGNFGQFYAVSMAESKLVTAAADSFRVFVVTEELGLPLAMAVQREHPDACALVLKAIATGQVSRAECVAISDALHPGLLHPDSEEAQLLVRFLEGANAQDGTAPARRLSLRHALIAHAAGETDLRRALYVQDETLRIRGDTANLTHWRAYGINEMTHIALELWLNALVMLINTAEQPRSTGDLAGALASLALEERTTPLPDYAAAAMADDLAADYALAEGVSAAAGRMNPPPTEAVIQDAARLILSLWWRWRGDTDVRRALAAVTVEGRSAEGVFRLIDRHYDDTAHAALTTLIGHYLISNHLTIAGQKLATGRFTYRFAMEDGCLVNGVLSEYGYTAPRLGTLMTFARDAGLIDRETDMLRQDAKAFIDAA